MANVRILDKAKRETLRTDDGFLLSRQSGGGADEGKDFHVEFTDLVNEVKGSQAKLVNRITVGVQGDFATLKAAVDWFNASATVCTEILMDAGLHTLTETVTIDNDPCTLIIRGTSMITTILQGALIASTELIKANSTCIINNVTLKGQSRQYDGIVFESAGDTIRCEMKSVDLDNFDNAIVDNKGVFLFLNDFIVENCNKGLEIDHANVTSRQTIAQIGVFDNCDIGIDLVAAPSDPFNIKSVDFINPIDGIGIKYNGTNYTYGDIAIIALCTYNNIGDFISGFDFTLERDANIDIFSNSGLKDYRARAYVSVVDNTATTTVVTAGTFYKANFVVTTFKVIKIAVDNNKLTILGDYIKNGEMIITGNLEVDGNNRTVEVGVRKNGAGAILSPFSVRTGAANLPNTFAFIVDIDDDSIAKDDYYEIWLTSSTNGDVVTIEDLTLLFKEN